MKQNDLIVCNVCGVKNTQDLETVFIVAHKGTQEVHICTSCMPSVIHGSGLVVKSNEELISELTCGCSEVC